MKTLLMAPEVMEKELNIEKLFVEYQETVEISPYLKTFLQGLGIKNHLAKI